MALMFAAELVTAGRIVAGCGPVTHFGPFRRGEHRQLPHKKVIPQTIVATSVFDHAQFNQFRLLRAGGKHVASSRTHCFRILIDLHRIVRDEILNIDPG
jgi:hypothetical protein